VLHIVRLRARRQAGTADYTPRKVLHAARWPRHPGAAFDPHSISTLALTTFWYRSRSEVLKGEPALQN